jgi:hypothetical protein
MAPPTPAAFTKLVQAAARIDKAKKAIDPKFGEVVKKLDDAMAGEDDTMIDVYLNALRGEVDKITAAMGDVDTGVIALSDLEQDDAFMTERLADVEKASKVVAKAKKDFTVQFQTAKRLENAAEKASTAALKADDLAVRQLARLDRFVKDEAKGVKALYQKAEDLNTTATAAFERRDAKGLADAQKALAALEIAAAVFMWDGQRKSVEQFQKDADDPKYADAVRADMKDGARDLLGLMKGGDVYVEQLQKIEKRVVAFKVEPIKVSDARDALGLDKKYDRDLGAALNAAPAMWEKGLGAVAKKAGADTTGKKMLEALRKAGVI